MSDFERRILELQLVLPPAPKPVGAYQPVVIEGGIAFLSGQISKTGDGKILSGKLGKEVSLEAGREAARIAVLNVLSMIKHLIGFNRFKRILRIVGYVQTDPSFFQIPDVVNGASELLIQVFEEKGMHARSAVGVSSLPLNASVEIEATIAIQ